MKSIFRTLVVAPAVLAVAALAINTASAEEAHIKVPFSFTVNGKICPAGTYSLARDNNYSNVVTLRGKDTASFTWVLGPGDAAPTDSKVVLRFDETSDTHALNAIQYGPLVKTGLDKNTKHTEHATTRIIQGQ
jgi:hypothetical protein